MGSKFQVSNWKFFIQKKRWWEGDTIISPLQPLTLENTSVGIRLIADTVNYKQCFRHCISQNILHVFLLFIFVWNKKYFFYKNWAIFYVSFLIWFGVAFDIIILKFLCFWCSLYDVIGNQRFFSFKRYNLSEQP